MNIKGFFTMEGLILNTDFKIEHHYTLNFPTCPVRNCLFYIKNSSIDILLFNFCFTLRCFLCSYSVFNNNQSYRLIQISDRDQVGLKVGPGQVLKKE